jgi:hypothetical protein
MQVQKQAGGGGQGLRVGQQMLDGCSRPSSVATCSSSRWAQTCSSNRGLHAVAADSVEVSLGPDEVAVHLTQGLGRVGRRGDAVLGQQAGQRGRADDDFLPQGRGRGFEIRETLVPLRNLPRRPAGQRFPGDGQAALLDGGGTETHHRVAGPA